jgi:hypothetical protein
VRKPRERKREGGAKKKYNTRRTEKENMKRKEKERKRI